MPDREKVIKALECRKNADKRCENPCEETGMCHYATAVRDINGEIYRPFICDRERICTDVLDLLKEQEAVKPVKQIEQTEWTVCGNCRNHIISKWIFCPYCGRSVKWE
jgi:hypothetical protein